MQFPVPALLAMLFLSGCAVPPAVAVASLAANGVSFATTGKSTTDHAISAVVGEDCALLRAASEKEICDPDGEVLIALEVTETPDADWYVDLESGEATTAGLDTARSSDTLQAAVETAPALPQHSAGNKTSMASLAPAAKSATYKSLDHLAALAAEPAPRGVFADARPAPKPETPPLPQQLVSAPVVQQAAPPPDAPKPWISRLTERTRGIFGKPRQQ
ncbi:MAG: hypothetical protein GKS02_06420 [Alphaproteobacteria bacterium]|nr:hypothetical protein [Alphaproteobacteria bacterium]